MNPLQILDYLDGRMSGEERRAFEALLAQNPDLRAEVAGMEALRAGLRTPAEGPVVGLDRTLLAIRAAATPWWARWSTGHWVAASGCAVFLMGVILTVQSKAKASEGMMLASDRVPVASKAVPAPVPDFLGGYATLRVADPQAMAEEAATIGRETGGSVSTVERTSEVSTLEINLPGKAFDQAWRALLGVGEVEAKAVYVRNEESEVAAVTPGRSVIRIRLVEK